MRTLPAILTLSLMAAALADYPDDVREIREEQQFLADAKGVKISVGDQPWGYYTSLESVPPEVAYTMILEDSDLEEMLPLLKPYYGMGENDELFCGRRESHGSYLQYRCWQSINGIRVKRSIEIRIDSTSLYITRVRGALLLNFGLEKSHRLSKEEAIGAALDYVRSGKSRIPLAVQEDGDHDAELSYAMYGEQPAMRLWWLVRLQKPKPKPELNPEGKVFYEYFNVDPAGKATSLVEESIVH